MALIGFGVTLIAGGIYWKLYDDVFNLYISKYVYDSGSEYWLGSDLLWHIFPFALMFLGIIVLLMGALKGRSTRVVYEQ